MASVCGFAFPRQSFIVFVSVFALAAYSLSFAQCHYDLNGVGYGRNCPYRGGSTSSGAAAQQQRMAAAAAAEAQRKWNAAATAQNKLAIDAFDNNDYATAEAQFKECLQYWPNDPVILGSIAAAEQQQGFAAYRNRDYETALAFLQLAVANDPPSDQYHGKFLDQLASIQKRVDAVHAEQAKLRQDRDTSRHIDQSIQTFTQTLTPAPASGELDFNDGKAHKDNNVALMQARVAAGSEASANCIFSGAKGCGAPVALVQVSAGTPPVPVEAAKFVEGIPKSVREKPAVKRDIDLYEHMASVRATIQNQMIADQTAVKAHPNDEAARLKVMEDSGHLQVAKEDEKKAKQRVSMSIGLIPQTPLGIAPGKAGTENAAADNPSTK